MHFLVDASLPTHTAPFLRSLGNDATDVRDIGMGSAADADIAAHAQSNGYCILARDFDFADVRNYPSEQYAGIAVVDLPNHAIVPQISALIRSLVSQLQLLGQLPGHFVIVSPGRFRFRPGA